MAKDFHRAYGRRGERLIEKQNGDFQHGCLLRVVMA
jgi:hypothetical protein